MKNYKQAWTMAELTVAMIVLGVLMGLSIQVMKPHRIKVIPFAYAAVKNLTGAAKYVLKENNSKKLPDDVVAKPVANSNKTCVQMAEILSLVGNYTCVKTTATKPASTKGGVGNPNFQTSNLITYSGLEKDYTVTQRGTATASNECATVDVGMKDLMIDVNGDDGDNKVGIDQFPVKLLQSGEVVPGTCANITSGTAPSVCSGKPFASPTFARHPSCGANTTKFIDDKYPFGYNVYRSRVVTDAEIASGEYKKDERITETVAMEISFAKADCISRNNVLTRTQCAKLGYAPYDDCIDAQSFCVIRQTKPLSMNIFALPY